MFRHLSVILREFQNLCLITLRNFVKLMLLKLQFHKIIRLKYINIYAPSILYIGQAFCYSPENAFHIFNQQIYFII